jgi:hypothetical protein
METTHVFIVDTTTFRLHLEYLFAGTGAKDSIVDFNARSTTKLQRSTEDNLVAMIADAQRVRAGDYVIFYVQQNAKQGIAEGKFYGIFKIKDDLSFLDDNDQNQFLKAALAKSLTFRTLIVPYEVYAKGVTEWEALDEIRNIQAPYQMLWSLIYRKLKGYRGNTMITIYESERLFKLLRDKNNRQTLSASNFTYDLASQEIQPTKTQHNYTGRREPINVLPRLLEKYNSHKAFEKHLQAYIVQNIGRGTNATLDYCLLEGLIPEWLGNEVACGVGMQKIDVMLSLLQGKTRFITPIELKASVADPSHVLQIQRYVDWLEQYYLPNRISDTKPLLITMSPRRRKPHLETELFDSFREFNRRNPKCLPLKYVEYQVRDNELVFTEIPYTL